MDKTLVLFFNNDQVYLAPGCGIGMDRTNIPHTYQPFRQGIYWTVSILKTSSINGKLITRVKDYCGSPESFSIQKAPSEIPPGIIINDISTSKLFEAWDKTKNLPSIKNKNSENSQNIRKTVKSFEEVRVFNRNIFIPWNKLTYSQGEVSFEYTPVKFLPSLEIIFKNSCIRPEMEYITSYLAKATNSKDVSFDVEFNVTYNLGDIRAISVEKVFSPEIDSLSTDILENVNNKILYSSIFKQRQSKGTELNLLADARSPTAKSCSPQEALKEVLSVRDSKHHKQLDYLASLHLHHLAGLRFTTDPVAFLFLLEGENSYFFALEVHDQKLATYLWSIEKTPEAIEDKLQEIESLMKLFREGNRLNYRNSRPEKFFLIEHDYSDPESGFKKWEKTLLETLKFNHYITG